MEKAPNRIKRLFSTLAVLWVGWALAAANGCCNLNPSAILFGSSPDYPWVYRNVLSGEPLQVDSALAIDEVVASLFSATEYSFKVGPDGAINCNSAAGYSPWRPRTQNLQASLSSYADGVMELCIIGRGTNSCGELKTQPFANANVYRWQLSRNAGIFSITAPQGLINDNTPTIRWSSSNTAQSYDVSISLTNDCTNPVQTITGITTTFQDVDTLPDGNYFACVSSRNQFNQVTNATNNGFAFSVDSTPPGSFSIMAPTGTQSSLTTLATWTGASGADYYNLTLATDAGCTSVTSAWNDLTSTSAEISVPAEGDYYLCAEAADMAGNTVQAPTHGFNVNIPLQETIVKDHVSDPSCWNTVNNAFLHHNSPSNSDAIAAATITGGGGIIKRVGGIFSDQACSGQFNNGQIEEMQASVAFYENINVFLTDPYLINQPPGSLSKRVDVPKLHTDPQDPQYFLNPVRVTPTGTSQYYIEVDVSSESIQTTAGGQHLVALWFSSESTDQGVSWMAFSKGCTNQVGNSPDYYISNSTSTQQGPGEFSSLSGAAHSFAAYFVSELQ